LFQKNNVVARQYGKRLFFEHSRKTERNINKEEKRKLCA